MCVWLGSANVSQYPMINCLLNLLSSCNFRRKTRRMYIVQMCAPQHWVLYASVYNFKNRKSMTYFSSECTHQTQTSVTHTHSTTTTTTTKTTVSLFCPHWKRERRKKALRITWVCYDVWEREKFSVVSLKLNNYDPTSIDLCFFVCCLSLARTHMHARWRRSRRKNNVFNVATMMTDIFIFF